MLKADGIHMPSIKINSWKAISRSKIELLEYEKISALASIEEQKELLESKTELLINFLYSNIKETGSYKKELIILMMQDIIVTEKVIHLTLDRNSFRQLFQRGWAKYKSCVSIYPNLGYIQ